MTVRLDELLSGKWEDGTRPKDLYRIHISKEPEIYVADIIEGLGSEDRKVQSGFAELASLLSEDQPGLLYEHIDLFLDNIGSDAPVLRWEAVCTLGNLACVDEDGRTREGIDTMLEHLNDKSIVLQGHSVRALTKIAIAFPDTAPEVLDHLIAAKAKFPGSRVGYLIEAMPVFAGMDGPEDRAKAFVEEHLEVESKSVVRKAKRALKRF